MPGANTCGLTLSSELPVEICLSDDTPLRPPPNWTIPSGAELDSPPEPLQDQRYVRVWWGRHRFRASIENLRSALPGWSQ
jgi:hypothetical protein